MDELFGKENYWNTVTLTTNEPSGFKATGDKLFSTANYLLIYAKGGTKSPLKKVYIENEYDSMYSYVLDNRDVHFSKWEWSNIRDIVAKENGYDSVREAKKDLGEEFDLQIADYAINNAHRVFRTAAISGGARRKRMETIRLSKENRDQVFVHPNEDVPEFYILNGEQILFYENRIENINGQFLPGRLITDVWTDISWTGIANEGGVTLKYGKKPEKLLHRILDMSTNPGDLIVDFFLGSGTTAAVAHKMGRQYIGIEQLDYGKNSAVIRLQNVINGDKTGISKFVDWKGGGSFAYCELMEWNEYFVGKIEVANDKDDVLNIWQEIQNKAHLSYKVDIKSINENVDVFEDLSLENQKKFLIEVLDKNALYVNFSEIDDIEYGVTDEDKRLNRQFYGVEA